MCRHIDGRQFECWHKNVVSCQSPHLWYMDNWSVRPIYDKYVDKIPFWRVDNESVDKMRFLKKSTKCRSTIWNPANCNPALRATLPKERFIWAAICMSAVVIIWFVTVSEDGGSNPGTQKVFECPSKNLVMKL
jgi:hypothetical protein